MTVSPSGETWALYTTGWQGRARQTFIPRHSTLSNNPIKETPPPLPRLFSSSSCPIHTPQRDINKIRWRHCTPDPSIGEKPSETPTLITPQETLMETVTMTSLFAEELPGCKRQPQEETIQMTHGWFNFNYNATTCPICCYKLWYCFAYIDRIASATLEIVRETRPLKRTIKIGDPS